MDALRETGLCGEQSAKENIVELREVHAINVPKATWQEKTSDNTAREVTVALYGFRFGTSAYLAVWASAPLTSPTNGPGELTILAACAQHRVSKRHKSAVVIARLNATRAMSGGRWSNCPMFVWECRPRHRHPTGSGGYVPKMHSAHEWLALDLRASYPLAQG